MAQERVVSLEGVHNFRDYGGYPAAGGLLRRGALYRSAHFAEATPADGSVLDGFGVTTIVDLRRAQERRDQPSRWPPKDGAAILAEDDSAEPQREPPHIAFLRQPDLTADAVDQFMVALYREIPFDPRHQRLFSGLFRAIDADAGATVVHCAAGKDRTGVVCALVLRALGVDPATIMDDYLLTNTAVNVDGRMAHIQGMIESQLGRSVSADALRPMLGVRASFLTAAFDAIGDIDVYLEKALGVDARMRVRMRAALVG